MTSQQVADALVAWARATCPEIATGYAYPPAAKPGALPDVAAEDRRVLIRSDDDRFPRRSYEQTRLRVFEMELSFMVEADPPDTATNTLRSFSDRLFAAVLKDNTLGGRVPSAAEEVTATFDPIFVEFEDGVRGRVMTIEMAVGEEV